MGYAGSSNGHVGMGTRPRGVGIQGVAVQLHLTLVVVSKRSEKRGVMSLKCESGTESLLRGSIAVVWTAVAAVALQVAGCGVGDRCARPQERTFRLATDAVCLHSFGHISARAAALSFVNSESELVINPSPPNSHTANYSLKKQSNIPNHSDSPLAFTAQQLFRFIVIARSGKAFLVNENTSRSHPSRPQIPLAAIEMLRHTLLPARNALRRAMADTTTRRPRLHQPLGTVPAGTDPEAVRSKWGSNAMDKIQETPAVEVDGNVAACNGGGGALGHPIEYIKLLVSDEDAGPQVCKYCGLKFVRKHHH